MATTTRITGSYGIDAPYIPTLLFGTAVVSAIFAVLGVGGGGVSTVIWLIWCAAFLFQVALFLHTTLRGKFAIWREAIDELHLAGDENALDLGCGRGMVMITTAKALTSGKSVGIDLWRSRDQSGNDPETTRVNAIANGVEDRIEIKTEDMSALSFPDNSFDLVTASAAIQNIKDRELRRQTISEILRVLKPGGRVRIVDMQYVRQYRDDLASCGATGITVTRLGMRGVYGNFFAISRLVSAQKPE